MIRKIIEIDENKCNGCGLCAKACHEGAIEMVDGKAKLTREDYCDGLGDCLPACPTGAISFVTRSAPAYDEQAVLKAKRASSSHSCPSGHSCPSAMAKVLKREGTSPQRSYNGGSQLMQWPCQIKLVPVRAPYFDGANLLIAADCTAYAYASFGRSSTRSPTALRTF